MVLAITMSPAAAAEDPPLRVPEATLAAALHCPKTFSHPAHEPVLLVHGTFTNDEENWGWNYAKVLPAIGYDVCTVTLPNRSLDDIQVASEYVVHGIRAIAAASGRKVDVMGHSQGGLEPRWALRWWPSLRDQVDDMVTLATPNHGTELADRCNNFCPPAAWQMAPGSKFIAALNSEDETPGGVSYTSVYSLTDELVQPATPNPTAALAGGTNVLIQDVCPGRPVDHVGFAYDNAVYHVVIDAFTHPGAADPSRIDTLAACADLAFPGVNPASEATLLARELDTFPDWNQASSEPALASYAQPQPAGAPASGSASAAPAPPAGSGGGSLPATGALPVGLLGASLLALVGLAGARRR